MPETVAFILSTGRTGTKALAEGLAGEGIASPHQPPFSRILNVASNWHFNGRLSMRAMERLVCATRERQIRRCARKRYVQVFAMDYLPALVVSQRIPGTRIVHVARDPRSFVRSYINWVRGRWKSAVANYLVPGWHPSGALTGDVPRETWRVMDRFQRVCWHWTWKNRKIESLFGNSPLYLRIRFEDLFGHRSGRETLERMLSFLDIPFEERFLAILSEPRNSSRKDRFPPFDQWPRERKIQLTAICGELAGRYGYSIEVGG